MMKIILASFLVLLSLSVVDAAAWATMDVECSRAKESNATFQACATTSFSTPSPIMTVDGGSSMAGGYFSEFRMTTGLKKGVSVASLTDKERKKAYKNGITVQVALGDDDLCTVTVNVKAKSSECKSCKHCGDQKFTVDCTNVANGRKTKCESAKGSQEVGRSKVFFPLKKVALASSRLR